MKLLFSLVLLTSIFTATGCLKKAPKQAQYGPESQPEEIKLGLQKAASQISPFSMKKGDFVHLVTRQKFVSAAGPQQVILSEQGVTIVDKREDDYQIKYSLVKTNVEYKSTTEYTTTQTEDQVTISKPSTISAQSLLLKGQPAVVNQIMNSSEFPLVNSRAEPTVTKLTYHNYKSVEVDLDVPDATKKRPDCGGLPRCKFKAQQISYDEVYWMADGSSKKVTNRFLLSSEVPYQGFLVMQCQGSTGVAGGTFTAYEQCTELEDFLHGQP